MKRSSVGELVPLSRRFPNSKLRIRHVSAVFALLIICLYYSFSPRSKLSDSAQILARCEHLSTPAGPPANFQPSSRVEKGSDRYVPGTPPTLIRNAKIWTGGKNGTEVIAGDILLDKGLIMSVGHIPREALQKMNVRYKELRVVDIQGRWVTPGLVDLHSHIGVSSSPLLSGAKDGNSYKAPILPWLRSIDGLNTHDASYQLAVAGGVTTAQVLPGSANNIGGQSFLIKLRPTSERSATSKVLEPPRTLVGNATTDHLNWRHMKHACGKLVLFYNCTTHQQLNGLLTGSLGENPDRVYSQTRMDAAWNFRHAYEEARKVKEAQDAFCARVQESNRGWSRFFNLGNDIVAEGDFPESLQWESLVDVLRGRVKLSIHCYEAVDLDAIVRLSNEFKFPIASFHHAGETYLVPDLLKKAWGGVPTIALFASNARKKREAYRGSEFAPRVLAENGIPVVMKSDHPVLNSRYLLYEAQQAHYYGLDPALALLSVTSTPAKAAGVGHRIGTIAQGFDADIAVWDSHPLALGATPTQVYIDGVAQLNESYALVKPRQFQHVPKTPNWTREAQQAVAYDGLPPLRGLKVKVLGPGAGGVKFLGVKSAWVVSEGGVRALFDEEGDETVGKTVFVRNGDIVCFSGVDDLHQCIHEEQDGMEVVDLQGGSLAPGLTTFGSPLGLVEIRLEPSTSDGVVFDPLTGTVPAILGEDDVVIRAVDGLQFEGRNTLLAYRNGVTRAVTAPLSNGFLSGFSATFDVGATHAAEKGAIVQAETALHISISLSMRVSVSTQIATLRQLLYKSTSRVWANIRKGVTPLVINVDSADIMATILTLKSEYEEFSRNTIRVTFAGGSEAHLLADEIAKAKVSVILTSPRPYPGFWEERRILPGPPLSQQSGITTLLAANVNVAIGVMDEFNVRNTRFDIGWAALESNGTISKARAMALATTSLNRALGVNDVPDLVAYWGGSMFDMESKVVGVVSRQRRSIELF